MSIPADKERLGALLFWLVLLGVLLPRLLTSTPEYCALPLLLACGVALVRGWRVLAGRVAGRRGLVMAALGGVLVVHAAALVGAVGSAAPLGEALWLGVQGLGGVGGIAVLVSVLGQRPWPRRLGRVFLVVIGTLLVGSLLGYYLAIERFIDLGPNRDYFDSFRMALIWPTRVLTAGLGQLVWDNTVYAGFYFSLTAVLVIEWLGAGAVPRARGWWCLVVMLLVGVFLTGSRAAWLMLAVSLPFLLLGRPRRVVQGTLVALVVAFFLGWLGLEVKIATTETSRKNPGERHLSGLFLRGSAGRFDGYNALWAEIGNRRMTGQGLAATGRPIGELLHEHSSMLATVRGSGLAGLAGHLVVLAAAAVGAFRQLQRGRRWPAVLLLSVVAAISFDRSSVFRLTGNFEFLAHWVAVAAAILLAPEGRSQTDGVLAQGRKDAKGETECKAG